MRLFERGMLCYMFSTLALRSPLICSVHRVSCLWHRRVKVWFGVVTKLAIGIKTSWLVLLPQ